jgi:hypothetical protein
MKNPRLNPFIEQYEDEDAKLETSVRGYSLPPIAPRTEDIVLTGPSVPSGEELSPAFVGALGTAVSVPEQHLAGLRSLDASHVQPAVMGVLRGVRCTFTGVSHAAVRRWHADL